MDDRVRYANFKAYKTNSIKNLHSEVQENSINLYASGPLVANTLYFSPKYFSINPIFEGHSTIVNLFSSIICFLMMLFLYKFHHQKLYRFIIYSYITNECQDMNCESPVWKYKLLDWIDYEKIGFIGLSLNPNAIHILHKFLENEPSKIEWDYFSENPNAIHLLTSVKHVIGTSTTSAGNCVNSGSWLLRLWLVVRSWRMTFANNSVWDLLGVVTTNQSERYLTFGKTNELSKYRERFISVKKRKF